MFFHDLGWNSEGLLTEHHSDFAIQISQFTFHNSDFIFQISKAVNICLRGVSPGGAVTVDAMLYNTLMPGCTALIRYYTTSSEQLRESKVCTAQFFLTAILVTI